MSSTARRVGITALATALAIVATLVPTASPVGADHTAVPASVALVGSLQSALGCPGDWQPDCPTTELLSVDGSPGVFRATFDVPVGTFEYKVALNDSWFENYGAGGLRDGANIALASPGGPITFTYDHSTHVISDSVPRVVGSERRAQWLRRGLVALDLPNDRRGFTYRLHHSPSGSLRVEDGAVAGGAWVPMSEARRLPPDVAAQFPHLASYEALELTAAAQRQVEEILLGQIAVAVYDNRNQLVRVTGVQIAGVLDDVYAGAAERQLGVSWDGDRPTVALWAPTARHVDLLVGVGAGGAEQRVSMRRDHTGTWSAAGDPGWRDASYAYAVTVYVPGIGRVVENVVTDPYSTALTTDSARSVMIDLEDPALAPSGWTGLSKPPLDGPEGALIYELHVRDFSIADRTVPAAHRGRFLGFTHPTSAGMSHLRTLAGAGATFVQLLPVSDFTTAPERADDQQVPPCVLTSMAPDSDQQQACIGTVADRDGFNWGYDPWHHTTPEGSYVVDPSPGGRTRELRAMVAGINAAGLRVAMDVVYNHTSAAGQNPASVLDRIVPGYYHRLTASGDVETSSCCPNTATEHRMMEKLMVDSVVTWARHYKVDAFRFDVMAHHSKANMVRVREALDELTMASDGVDGTSIYLYGEGWSFGEVADDARFVQASQANLGGTGIGSFNDRLRDAVRGAGTSDGSPRRQGFGSGLVTDPNGDPANGTPDQQRARLLFMQDMIKLGLAGNLADYSFVDRTGSIVRGGEIDFGGSPAGYASHPRETINFVDVHDNETLFDNLQYKLPQSRSMADRVRMSSLSLAVATLGQGVTLWHGGTDLLRSKSLDGNSYNSGDWFNRVDWTMTESTWGAGLPPVGGDERRWELMRPLLADRALKPGPSDIAAASERALELLRIDRSSPLFRLSTAADIQRRVGFPIGGPGQAPGVIVMTLDDVEGVDLDPSWERIVVVFNASVERTSPVLPAEADRQYGLHPVQVAGGDDVVRTSTFDPTTGAFSVPARTVAVFVSG